MSQCNEDLDADTARGEVAAASAVLKAMGNEYRLLALLALAQQPLAVHELNLHLPLAQSALSQHLARLRAAGLVTTRRDGPKIRYSLADRRAERLLAVVVSEYAPSLAGLPLLTEEPIDTAGTPSATDIEDPAARELTVGISLPPRPHEAN